MKELQLKYKDINNRKKEEAYFYNNKYQFYLRKGQEWKYIQF